MASISGSEQVLIRKVGLRDGLQSVQASMPAPHKLRWIDALAGSGLREIQVGSFVSARLLPQMADTAEVVRHARTLCGLTVMALVPNLRGAQSAFGAGVHKITIPVSASLAHSMANVRKTSPQMVDEVRAIVGLKHAMALAVQVDVGISTAFGCTLQGVVPERVVIDLAEACVAADADEVGLSDTTGMANPAQVRRLFLQLRAAIGVHAGAAHLHNTRGHGLANCLAAFDVGVRTLPIRWANWAAAWMRRARLETWLRKIWFSCLRPWVSAPEPTCSAGWRRANPCEPGCLAKPCTA